MFVIVCFFASVFFRCTVASLCLFVRPSIPMSVSSLTSFFFFKRVLVSIAVLFYLRYAGKIERRPKTFDVKFHITRRM